MKKLLISILIVLLVILAYFTIFKGLSFGTANVLSVGQIINANEDLKANINLAQSLLKKDFPAKKEELSSSVTKLLEEKENYFSLAKISTDGEITKANTEETYLIEYLWTRVGRHATSKGVNLKMDVNTGEAGEADLKNLVFTVTGEYVGIIEFIAALENDDKLNFKIEDYRMVKNETNLTATFTVRAVRIKTENISNTGTAEETNTQASGNATNENTAVENETSRFNELTGAVDNTLAPAENNVQ